MLSRRRKKSLEPWAKSLTLRLLWLGHCRISSQRGSNSFRLSRTTWLGSIQSFLSQVNSQRADERAPSSLLPENICRAVITKRLASLTGKASKDLPFGLVASLLEKGQSRIRLSDVGSCLKKFPLSGVSLKKHFTGTQPFPLTPRAETASIPSTAVRPFSNPTALLPRVEEKATDLAYFDYAILPISKEEKKK